MNNNNTAPQKKFVRGEFPPQDFKQQLYSEYGIELTKDFLRLLPYLDYVLKNGGVIDLCKLHLFEVDYINQLCDFHLLEKNDLHIKCISKPFYDLMSDILFYSYVEH